MRKYLLAAGAAAILAGSAALVAAQPMMGDGPPWR